MYYTWLTDSVVVAVVVVVGAVGAATAGYTAADSSVVLLGLS